MKKHGLKPAFLLVLVIVAFSLLAPSFGAPQTNSVGWNDNFENYTNQTPLIDGTNGWYADSSSCIVQTNTVKSGANAAMAPTDCTLSNRFVSTTPTNVWIQMDVRPALYNGVTNNDGINYTIYPPVDTNVAVMFYVNTNGNFVVLDGPETNSLFNQSTNWVAVTGLTISTNASTWVRVNIYQDFANTNWNLYADGLLVTNNIGFITPNRTNFTGFEIYNGGTTSYLDNVSVVDAPTNSRPPLIVIPSALSQSNLYAGVTPPVWPNVQTVRVINVWSDPIGFRVETNQDWVSASPVKGLVVNGTTQDVVLTYKSNENWVAGTSNATVTVVATNATPAEWGTQTVQVVVNMLALSNVLYVTPTWFSNDVWVGATPTNRTFEVRNLGDLSFTYTVATGAYWIASSSNAGTLGAYGTNVLTLTNTVSTVGWTGLSNTWVDVVASNSEVMATQRVLVAVNVLNFSDVLSVVPTYLTNAAWRGDKPTNQTFVVSNKSDASFVYNVTTGASWIASSQTGGMLAARSASTVTQTYASTLDWQGASSSSWVKVATSEGGGTTQQVDVTVNIMDFEGTMVVTPLGLTNTAWIGDTPTSRSFQVSNTGDLSLVYSTTVMTGTWVTATAGSALPAKSTNTVTLTYTPTWAFVVPQSNTTVKVVSTNGCGATQYVAVVLNLSAPAANYYVATNGAHQTPFTNWAMAASNLTSAVYKANFYTNAGSVVWLSNGLYNLPNQVTISNVTVRSVNGAGSVTLNGGNLRGFNLVHTGAVLNGLTITNCSAGIGTNGGAVFVATGLVWNCSLLRNKATNGGGVAVGGRGVVRNCLIWGNTATNGGGVYYVGSGLVENCTIASNYAVLDGGGLYTATNMTGLCVNVVVYQNLVGGSGVYSNWGTNINAGLFFTNCDVGLPVGASGANIITADPRFINVATGNCRLAQGSPCINAGTNQAWMTTDTLDLAGNLRVRFGRVDIGAYEWYLGIKVNGVPYERIRFINGAEPLRIDGIP